MQKIKKVFAAYENETCVLKLQRDVIWVVGPDAGKYLQGQLTQDVLAMEEGQSVWSFLLNPDGKVNAWLRITHIGEYKYLLDCLLYTSPSPRDQRGSRMPSSA